MTTYKQLQDSWICSQWVDSGVEDFGEDTPVIIPDGIICVTIPDIMNKNITRTNYHDIVKLADYIMVENVDPLIDEIVRVTNNVDIVYEFKDFYKLSKRLKPLTKKKLKKQIREFNTTTMEMLYKYGHSSFWDVSKIKDMSNMFELTKFNGDISQWNVSKVKDMFRMFQNSKFNGDISHWNVSNVNNMCYMFYESQFNGDISEWNVSRVINMSYMFEKSKFNGDISRWNVSNVTLGMVRMFKDSKFNDDISDWNVSNVTNMVGMFKCSQFNGNISRWNVSNVTSMRDMFCESQFNGDISEWDITIVKTKCLM